MYDVAPDCRFLMLEYVTPSGQRDDLGPQVVLVQNWLDKLRERLPNQGSDPLASRLRGRRGEWKAPEVQNEVPGGRAM